MTITEALVVLAAILAVALLAAVHAWSSYRMNRALQKENFRLLQCNLALSERPLAFPMAQAAEETARSEIASERDQALAANGHAPIEPRKVRMQS